MAPLIALIGITTLFLTVLIGVKLRKAGKALGNEHLIHAGSIWLTIIGLTALSALISLSQLGILKIGSTQSEVCECMQLSKDIAEEIRDNKDADAIRALQEKYAGEIKECEKLNDGKTDEEKKAMMIEAQNCK
jgi:hypothetical protein